MNWRITDFKPFRLLFSVFWTSSIHLALLAQETSAPQAPKIIPLTPSAAALGKYGDLPVSFYTGQAQVSIPLHQMSVNDFSLPISLSYNYNGLRPEEYPSWVGTGWTLNVNGVINRQQRGLADEAYNKGYYYKGTQVVSVGLPGASNLVYQPITNELVDNTTPAQRAFLNQVALGTVDGEPDMFVFSFPGGSGKFFFDENHNPVLVPRQNLGISATFSQAKYLSSKANGSITSFTITDGNGIEYLFKPELNQPDFEIEPGDPEFPDFSSSWFLARITTPNGNTIEFHYQYRALALPPTFTESRTISLQRQTGFESTDNYSGITPYFSSTMEAILQEVIVKKGEQLIEKATFVEGAQRLDWNFLSMSTYGQIPKVLSQIQITNQDNKLIKRVEFSYDYFNNNSRLKLTAVKETGGLNGTLTYKNPHEFTYFDGDMPAIGAVTSGYQVNGALLSQDHWGYYTNDYSNTLLPPFKGTGVNMNTGATYAIDIPGNSREPSFAARVGLLTRIKYPTGGVSEFTYEQNDYWGEVRPDNFNPCAGGTVEVLGSAEATFSEVETSTFTVEPGLGCIRVYYTLKSNCIDSDPYVLISDGQGGQVFYYSRGSIVNQDKGNVNLNGMQELILDPGTYTITANVQLEGSCRLNAPFGTSNQLVAMVSARVEGTRPRMVNGRPFAVFKAGGFRIAKIVDHPMGAPTANSRVREFQYQTTGPDPVSSGVIVNQPVYVAYKLQEISTSGDEGSGEPNTGIFQIVQLSASSQVPMATTQGSHIGYSHVTVLDGSLGANGKTEYWFTTANDFPDGSNSFPFAPAESYDWQRGAQLKSEIYDTQAHKLQELQSSYKTLVGAAYYKAMGIKAGKYIEDPTPIAGSEYKLYIFQNYRLVSGFQYADSQISIDYGTGGTSRIQTEQLFTYGNSKHLQPTQIVTTTSDQKISRTRMKYPDDYDLATMADGEEKNGISGLLSRRMKNIALETIVTENSSPVSHTKTIYQGALPKKTLVASGAGPLEERLFYDLYDAGGNLLMYHSSDNIYTSYLWDYNSTLPIAEIKNATYQEVTSAYPGGTLTTDSERINAMNALRNNPLMKKAMVSSYTYDPLVGMTSQTGPDGITIFYEYDELQRLKVIKDQQGNIVKRYQYHYTGQPQPTD